MSQPWVILTRRYGGDTTNPTAAQLDAAIAELYHVDTRVLGQSSR